MAFDQPPGQHRHPDQQNLQDQFGAAGRIHAAQLVYLFAIIPHPGPVCPCASPSGG